MTTRAPKISRGAVLALLFLSSALGAAPRTLSISLDPSHPSPQGPLAVEIVVKDLSSGRLGEVKAGPGLAFTGSLVRPYVSADAQVRGSLFRIDFTVSGAGPWSLESVVLEGAEDVLRRRRPVVLLSVHPGYLPRFGSDRQQVGEWLQARGYEWTILAVDHEEHWLCRSMETE